MFSTTSSKSSNFQLRDFEGNELTEPEISLIQFIRTEQQKIRHAIQEKQAQKVLLATLGGSAKIPPVNPASEPSLSQPTQQVLKSPHEESTSKAPKSLTARNQVDNAMSDKLAMDEILEEKSEEPGDIASMFGVQKDDTIVSTKIKKRDRAEMEDEDNIPVQVFFDQGGIVSSETWDSVENGENMVVYLPSFNLEACNTIGVKLDCKDSKGWAFNICPADDQYLVDVLFHFNPRYKGKTKHTIVMNDRQGTWGDGATEDMRNPAGILANTIELKVEIRKEGFLVFANNIYAAFFVHRRDISQFKDLKLVFIAKDDNGNAEEVKVHQVWWGHLDFKRQTLSPSINSIMNRALKATFDSVTNPMPPRTIIAEGLPLLDDLEALQGLEYNLLDLFEEYSVKRVSLVTGAGIGYIKLAGPEFVQPAIDANNNYAFQDQEGNEYTIVLRPMVPYPTDRNETILENTSSSL